MYTSEMGCIEMRRIRYPSKHMRASYDVCKESDRDVNVFERVCRLTALFSIYIIRLLVSLHLSQRRSSKRS